VHILLIAGRYFHCASRNMMMAGKEDLYLKLASGSRCGFLYLLTYQRLGMEEAPDPADPCPRLRILL
jgi:hypothetical protein